MTMTKDWQLLKSLEYDGKYGARYTCSMCKHFCKQGYSEIQYGTCEALADNRVQVCGGNNICKYYVHKIVNPSVQDFNFDRYLEFLFSDYYRPYTIDNSEQGIRGSARLGEVILDGGHLARIAPKTYSFFYTYYDLPYCKVNLKTCHVKIGIHNFEIDYRLYRKCIWFENNIIKYKKHYWKNKPTQRKYNSEINGEFNLNES